MQKRDEALVMEYRQLDKELALFMERMKSARTFEDTLFVPDMARKAGLEKEINGLINKVSSLQQPDPLFGLFKSHFMDFAQASKNNVADAFERPYAYISMLLYTFSNMVRTDSRDDETKAGIIIKRYGQAGAVIQGIRTWLNQVSPLYLQELVDAIENLIDTMAVEAPKIPLYFSVLSRQGQSELEQSVALLCSLLTELSEEAKALLASKGAPEKGAGEEDIIVFEEAYYRRVLWDQLGVSLDQILSWHETEVEKTRSEVFEIAGRLSIPENNPKSMSDVNDILLKYAGPAASPEEMFERGSGYLKRTQAAARDYVSMPEGEVCLLKAVPEQLKESYPWGGYGGGCPRRRPLIGEMFLNNYNFKNVTDGWIKMNTVHESYPGHHVQFLRCTMDEIPETVKTGAKYVPLMEGACHRSERLFEFVFEEDPFYPLFVAYRRHHTAVRIKADLMLRYFGRPVKDAVQLYCDELGFDRHIARGQVKAQESMQGYFTCYYYGMKKISDWEKHYGFDAKEYTELLFASGKLSLENFEKYLQLDGEDRAAFGSQFKSILQFGE